MAKSTGGGGFFLLRDSITPMLALGGAHIVEAAEDALKDMAPDILEYAKANAPWQDQTGAARSGLAVDVSREGTNIKLTLYHTVDYGLWLEVLQDGKFATIMPTLQHYENEVFRKLHAEETGIEGDV